MQQVVPPVAHGSTLPPQQWKMVHHVSNSYFMYFCFSCAMLFSIPGWKEHAMLTKKTSRNQITLPKAIARHFPDVDYFDVREEDGKIVLLPVRPNQADAVRERLASMGISEKDVEEAVRRVRSQ